LVLLLGTRRPHWRERQRAAAFVLLAYAIGPGLIVNVGFKNFWGRPRPVHVRQFGGSGTYQDVAEPGTPGRGKSFPCGHSSAGYALTAFWLLWKRRRPLRAAVALGCALAAGTALGIGRVITGSHFASDVLASGVIAHLANVVLYYFVLNVPGREDAPPAATEPLRIGRGVRAAWAAFGVGVAGSALLATPYYSEFRHSVPGEAAEASRLILRLPAAEVSLALRAGTNLAVSGTAEGFGMFHSRLLRQWASAGPELAFEIRRSGWFTDLAVDIVAQVPTSSVREVVVEMPGGWLAVDPLHSAPWRLDLDQVRARWTTAAPPMSARQPVRVRGGKAARKAPGA